MPQNSPKKEEPVKEEAETRNKLEQKFKQLEIKPQPYMHGQESVDPSPFPDSSSSESEAGGNPCKINTYTSIKQKKMLLVPKAERGLKE